MAATLRFNTKKVKNSFYQEAPVSKATGVFPVKLRACENPGI
jgi:hypothetical protein